MDGGTEADKNNGDGKNRSGICGVARDSDGIDGGNECGVQGIDQPRIQVRLRPTLFNAQNQTGFLFLELKNI